MQAENNNLLNTDQQGVLASLVEQQKTYIGILSSKAERISEEFKEDDAKNFNDPTILESKATPIEVVIPPVATPTPVTDQEYVPVAERNETIKVEPKRTRKTVESTIPPADQSVPRATYRIARRVNAPINGVQYSNNEHTVEVA